MKSMTFKTLTIVVLLALFTTANAVIIIVDGTDGAIDNTDGVCSISEAIINANDDAATYPDCAAGNFFDTIRLTVDVTLTSVIMNTRTGTPIITSGFTLDGQGHILQRDSSLTCTLDNTADIGEFRLLRINTLASVIVQNITLAHGCAGSSGESGAGIYNYDSELTIKNTTFDQNKAKGFGGGLYNGISNILEISNSTFSENLASSGGGAIYNSLGKIDTINNSTFSKNSTGAAYGGAIYNSEKKITIIRNCTFSENSSNSTFSAIYNDNNSGVITVISNNLFTQNVGSDCIIDSSTIYTNNITTNPGNFICNNITPNLTASTVGPLADNGGPTKTHALLQGSEALNMGGAGAITTDQRGFAADGVRDIGAYEAQIPVVIAPTNLMFEATGTTTAVTLGTATVTDADETGVTAVADISSPFAVGIHTVTWTATDSQGHEGIDTQTVTIVDTTPPTITPPMNINAEATGANTSVTLGTASARDLVDGNVSPVTANNTGPFTLGTHTITWSATDAAGNTGTATQTITLIDTTPPTVTAPANIIIEATGTTTAVSLGTSTATDLVDGILTPTANMSSPFTVGVHTITWSVTDNAGNTGSATQTVTVTDTTAPIISLLGNSVAILAIGDSYTDAGAMAFDIVDGDLTTSIVTVNPVNTALAGNYTITYNVTDSSTNAANQVTRLVKVQANIGGTVSGLLASNTISLSDGSQNLILGNGVYNFAQAFDVGSSYNVVLSQPTGSPSQTCTISNETGTISTANITNIDVKCSISQFSIGGSINGLASGNSIILQNNLGDDLEVNANGSFTFSVLVDDLSNYSISVLTQPDTPNQTCTITNNQGQLNGANVSNVLVACTTNHYFIGGMLTGLRAGNTVTIANNNNESLQLTSNGAFAFANSLSDQSNYTVTVTTNPTSPNQTCSISNATGTLVGQDISNISINCIDNLYYIGGNVSGLNNNYNLLLKNNGSDEQTITNNGAFVFATPLLDLQNYNVSFQILPLNSSRDCSISNQTGVIAGDDIDNVQLSCTFKNDLIFANGFE